MKTDEELVAAYQKRNDIMALNQLRSRVTPLIQSQVARYVSGPGHISRAALEARAGELFVDAAKSYKTGTGASFRTHLFNYLRRLDRYTKANANVAYVPEARASLITTFQTQEKILHDQKRRPPTDEEMADHLSWPLTSVQTLRKSMRREIPWSQVAAPQMSPVEKARIDQLFDDIYWELSPDEKMVFDHILGRHGKKKLSKGQSIARATGFSEAKVSIIRKRIAEKLRPHLGQQTAVTL